MKPLHVTRWLDAHPSWKGARRHGILAVKRAYSWAEKQGLLTPNPLKGVEQEAGGRRDRVMIYFSGIAVITSCTFARSPWVVLTFANVTFRLASITKVDGYAVSFFASHRSP